MSDNGAEEAVLEAVPTLQIDTDSGHFDNSYENIGEKNSFIWYGLGWAQSATAPSRLCKAYITEGGIRCSAIVHYTPLTIRRITHEFCTVMDILSIILELAGVKHPGTSFQGREIVLLRGKSWVSHFRSQQAIHDANEDFNGWELYDLSQAKPEILKELLELW